ncbi:MAG: DUF2378 family protein [Myxococcota bacterium]
MEKLWFHDAVESLFSRGLKGRVDPALKAALKPFIDLDRPLLPAYSAEAVEGTLLTVGAALFAELPREQRLFTLGRLAFESFRGTLLGTATVHALRLLGARRAVERVQRGYRAACNYLEVTVTATSEKARRVEFAGAGGLADFVAGTHQGVTEALGLPIDDAHWRYQVAGDGTVVIFLELP